MVSIASTEQAAEQHPPSRPCPPIIAAPVPAQLKAHAWKPGQSGNPNGRNLDLFNLRRRARAHGEKYFEALEKWAFSDDWRAAIPALRILLGAGYGEFDKIPAETGSLPAGFENLSVADRIRALNQRRAELAQLVSAQAPPVDALAASQVIDTIGLAPVTTGSVIATGKE